VATHWILGIRPQKNGLQIDPSIPADWTGFSVRRQFRGATYQIEVSNPQHVHRGVKSITVDGRELQGNLLPVFNDGQEHQIEVVLG
jgi:cellobiose phosphorylase